MNMSCVRQACLQYHSTLTIGSKQKLIKNRLTAVVLPLLLTLASCSGTTEASRTSEQVTAVDTETLEIWWDKGFTLEEDEALQKLVKDWEKQSGKKIKLSFYTTDELSQKVEREIRAGELPDIIAMFKSERSLASRLAWDGKLADVSDVIQPNQKNYEELALKSVNFYNNVDKKRSYYALPIHQATIHVYYWKGILDKISYSEKDIPKDWDNFWNFWGKAQNELKTKANIKIYGLGLPLSVEAGDTYQTFEQILEAYDIKILDNKGQLQVDDPQVRQGIIKILTWYDQTYQKGYFSPEALHWLNPDNNRSMLNREVLMTTNDTLAIATAVRTDQETYQNKLGLLELPNKPNGKPMQYLATVQQVILFADSDQQKEAKDFLSYLSQPEVIDTYLKASGGRHSPVLKSVWKDPFWTSSKDPHVSKATHTFETQPTRLFYTFDNPAYSIVLKENVWGKAINRVIVEKVSPEQAADEAIVRIKEIFDEWQ
jgi:multiple sugar transport system substrate-binding protein